MIDQRRGPDLEAPLPALDDERAHRYDVVILDACIARAYPSSVGVLASGKG